MKVTPRLPVHGAYSSSPFVEMRYLRFDYISLPAALLFALFECSCHPHHSALQSLLKSTGDNAVPKQSD